MRTCFISYSWDSRDHKEWVAQLAATIGRFGIRVIFDQDREQNPDGGDIPCFVRKGILESDFILIVVTPEYVRKADAIRGYIGQETTLIQQRRADGHSKAVLPLLLKETKLPAYLHGTKYIDMRRDTQHARQLTEVLRHMDALKTGIALRDAVFNEDDPLPDKVFAIELLRKPLWISRRDGRTSVSISRAGVELGVYTTAGRQYVVEDTFSGQTGVARARRLDRGIHRVFRSEQDLHRYPLDQPNLRWASGGVLSRVQYQRRTWFSFFFRDIPPFGWNTCLGASEHESELTDPWTFLMREFIEETLVCTPTDGPQTVRRPLVFDRLDVRNEIKRAELLSAKHRELRFSRDGRDFRRTLGDPVYCDIWPTRTELVIDGSEPIRNVLVCINLTELGIEVLKVLSYDLAEKDFILDGEIFEPAGTNQVELVRMPVALISEAYLRRAFASKETFNYASLFEARLPSIKGPAIPPSEIIIFPHDVMRCSQLATGRPGQATDWEKRRYSLWLDRFGCNFLDQDRKPTNANASVLFTPTSAKAMAYYFANVGTQRRSARQ